MEAALRKAVAVAILVSTSLARRRFRLSQAKGINCQVRTALGVKLALSRVVDAEILRSPLDRRR